MLVQGRIWQMRIRDLTFPCNENVFFRLHLLLSIKLLAKTPTLMPARGSTISRFVLYAHHASR